MKLSELYASKPEYETDDLQLIHHHIYESGYNQGIGLGYYSEIEYKKDAQIKIKVYADRCTDGRRIWVLASVWFNDISVMIIQTAGREGDDYNKRFISNRSAFNDMINYLRALLGNEPNFGEPEINLDQDLSDLTSFYDEVL